MSAWVLIVMLVTTSYRPGISTDRSVAVTTVSFATEADCNAARIRLGPDGLQSLCVKTGYSNQ